MGAIPPKIDAIRRNARVGPLLLPKGGRRAPAPEWPLLDEITVDQKHLWDQLWKTPQAVAWEQMEYTRFVARYTLLLLEAEKPYPATTLLAEVRQMEDRLGLTPKAMRMLMWEVSQDEVAERRIDRPQAMSARTRLRAIDAA